MNERYAVVDDGVVVNVVVWNGTDAWAPARGGAIGCSDEVAEGWVHADGVFAPPADAEQGA